MQGLSEIIVGTFAGLVASVVTSIIKNRHDTKLSQTEREYKVRSETYLQLFEEYTAAQMWLTKLAHDQLSGEEDGDRHPPTEFISSVRKANIVGSKNVLNLVNKLSALYRASYDRVQTYHEEMLGRKSTKLYLDETRESLASFRAENIALIRAESEKENPKLSRIEFFEQLVEQYTEQINNIFQQSTQMDSQYRETRAKAIDLSNSLQYELDKQAVNLLSAIKDELGIDNDNKDFVKKALANHKAAKSLVDSKEQKLDNDGNS